VGIRAGTAPRPVVQSGADATDRGEGIGAYVRATMAGLPESGRLTPEIVAELSNTRYSKTAAIGTDQGSQILAGVGVGLLTDATTDEFIEVFRQRHWSTHWPRSTSRIFGNAVAGPPCEPALQDSHRTPARASHTLI
jgi:hypothetical protein